MKEKASNPSKANSSNQTSSNTRSDQNFFNSSSSLFSEDIVQKKEAPFFEKTPSTSFFQASQSTPSPVQRQRLGEDELQMKEAPIQQKANPKSVRSENKTGLPDTLKTGMENLSGMSLDDVKVHRNSDKPADLQAHAYAQGPDIHLGPGQEKHLPHEAWHVVQQKQGRVKPTMQMPKQSGDPGLSGKSKVDINDDAGLEREADVIANNSPKVSQARAFQEMANSRKTQLPIQGKWIMRNGVRVEVKDDYLVQIEKGEREAPPAGGFDSLDLLMHESGAAAAPSLRSGLRSKAQQAFSGASVEDMYAPDKKDQLKDAIVREANKGGIKRAIGRYFNPRMGGEIQHQKAKEALEQEIHEQMISSAGEGRRQVGRAQLGGKALGKVTSELPIAGRALAGGKAYASRMEAEGYKKQAGAREIVGAYAVDNRVNDARAEEMHTRAESANIDSLGHATNAIVGGGGGVVSKGAKFIRGTDRRIKKAQKSAGNAIFEDEALNQLLRVQKEKEERRKPSEEFDQF